LSSPSGKRVSFELAAQIKMKLDIGSLAGFLEETVAIGVGRCITAFDDVDVWTQMDPNKRTSSHEFPEFQDYGHGSGEARPGNRAGEFLSI